MVAMVTGLATSLCPSTRDTEALVVSEMVASVSGFPLSNFKNHFKAYLIILHELKETKVIITKLVMCTL